MSPGCGGDRGRPASWLGSSFASARSLADRLSEFWRLVPYRELCSGGAVHVGDLEPQCRREVNLKPLVLLLSSLLVAPAFAQWKEKGVPIPDEPWRKSAGTFGAMLLLTDKPAEFLVAWESPETPTIETTEIAERGKPLFAFVVFLGCAEVLGVCNSSVDFTVFRPDGGEYASHKDLELWQNLPGPPKDALQLGVGYLGVGIEPDDPAGKYTVKAKVRDLIAGRDVEIQQHFTVK